ncbi:hypothetical protein GWO43_13405, partial [candidate division KSB1 bacterium]|nr:hypothetical protein [candidate division KSB1 bacterium]NIS24931.1 hypothetical protein [candidate division KSB1 bacterium]NIT71849.1 hypothetical protein [candidate division KSB1 bacterium]NIU25587.1 hypothetical protein [candidate division KSB1 bacterium]NIU93158.1 hypothetical protein [candidate division KSB1 bacterium]
MIKNLTIKQYINEFRMDIKLKSNKSKSRDFLVITRQKAGSIIAGIAAVGFLGTAALHSTGLDSITQIAGQSPTGLGSVAPALWLAFSFNLSVVGLIVAIIAFRPSTIGRLVLVVAALSPLSAATL